MCPEFNHSFFGIDEKIVLSKNGVWLSNGEEITHEQTVRAFSKNIFRSADGGFEIRLGNEKKSITVEDTIYFITSIDGTPKNGFNLRTNDGRQLILDATTLQYRDGRLTCKVPHPNDRSVEDAKFLSAPYHELLKHFVSEGKKHSITICGKKFTLN